MDNFTVRDNAVTYQVTQDSAGMRAGAPHSRAPLHRQEVSAPLATSACWPHVLFLVYSPALPKLQCQTRIDTLFFVTL